MDRFEALSAFVEVARHQSFAKASRVLRMSPPAVTRAVAGLESQYGVTLFRRSTRCVTLTDEGETLLQRANRILQQLREAEDCIAEASLVPRGKLVITAPEMFARLHIMPAVTDLLREYPQLSIRMVLADHNLNLIEDGIDLAVRFGPLNDSALTCVKFAEVRQIVVASPDYCRRRGMPSRPADLVNHDLIAWDNLDSTGAWHFGSALPEGIQLEPRVEMNSFYGMIDAAKNGLGIARVLDGQVIKELESGDLVQLLPEYTPPAFPINFVFPNGLGRKPALRLFIEAMKKYKDSVGDCVRAAAYVQDFDRLLAA